MIFNLCPRLTLIALLLGISTGSIYSINRPATAQTTSHTENTFPTSVANTNEVKSFIYSWFALLDRQVSEISLLKFLDTDSLTMQFPEMTVKNADEFSKWYLGVQKTIKTNTYNVKQLEVVPKDKGEFDVRLKVDWQATTRDGKAISQTYRQQWTIITDARNRLLIRDYLVEVE